MSWLSKALGGNTLKVGLALTAGYLGKEYLLGETTSYGYDISTGSMTTLDTPKFLGGNFAGDTLNRLGITPFSGTEFGQSKVGKALTGGLNFLGFSGNKDSEIPSLFTMAMRQQYGRFPQPDTLGLSVGTQGFRGDLNFQAGRSNQQFPIGRGGSINSALSREMMQQYLTKNVRAMGLPRVAPLPPVAMTSGPISTTRSRKRYFSKLTS